MVLDEFKSDYEEKIKKLYELYNESLQAIIDKIKELKFKYKNKT